MHYKKQKHISAFPHTCSRFVLNCVLRQIGVLLLCLQALLHQTAHLYGCLQTKQPIALTPIEPLLLAEDKALAAAYAKKDRKSAHKHKQMQTKQLSH